MLTIVVGAVAVRAFRPSGPIVVLDPGHGSADESGATNGDLIERDSNLDMAKRVQALLRAAGITVVLTRSTDGRADGLNTSRMDPATATFVDLQARVVKANAAHAAVFVSLHSNSFEDPSVRGIEAWYDADRPFADRNRALAEALSTDVPAQLRAAGFSAPPSKPRDEAGSVDAAGRTTPLLVLGRSRDVTLDELADRGVSPSALGLTPGATAYRTGETNAPGTLLELLYVSNEQDAALLRDPKARAAMASGIAQAILAFLADADTDAQK